MSKLPHISGDECRKALEKQGFEFARQKGSHMTLVRKDPFAVVSIPKHRELDLGTLHAILKAAAVTVDDFLKLL